MINSGKTVTDKLIDKIKSLSKSQQEDLLNIVRNWLSDQRKHNRQKYFMNIDYSDDHRLEHATIQNISTGGIFIYPTASLPTGRSIKVTFEHPTSSKLIEINGTIAWKDDKGVGIKFDREIDNPSE